MLFQINWPINFVKKWGMLTSERLIEKEDQIDLQKTRHHYICFLAIFFLFGFFVFRNNFLTQSEPPNETLSSSDIVLKRPLSKVTTFFLQFSFKILFWVCDTCQVIPELNDYSICKTCRFHVRNNKDLKCPKGQGDIKVFDVEIGTQHNAMAITLVYEQCAKNWY